MKGISPLIATVLLIAFTVAVAGLVSLWVSNFTKQTTNIVTNQTQQNLNCAFINTALSGVNYCVSRNELSGRITSNNQATANGITLQEVYSTSSPTQPLCIAGSSVINCTSSNLTIPPGYLYTFNISQGISSGFSLVNVIVSGCPSSGDSTGTWTSNC